jgi:hypothetical protein
LRDRSTHTLSSGLFRDSLGVHESSAFHAGGLGRALAGHEGLDAFFPEYGGRFVGGNAHNEIVLPHTGDKVAALIHPTLPNIFFSLAFGNRSRRRSAMPSS